MTTTRRSSWVSALAAAALLAVPAPVHAQYMGGGSKTAHEVQIADLEQVRDKFVALAGAFTADQLDWRPMEGVRSVREVLVLATLEPSMFPTMWGYEAPGWVEGGFGEEQARLGASDQEGLVMELGRSYDHAIALLREMDGAARAEQVTFFGLEVDRSTAVTLMLTDLHEHLGQLIAYARTNRVVPPWSRGEGGGA